MGKRAGFCLALALCAIAVSGAAYADEAPPAPEAPPPDRLILQINENRGMWKSDSSPVKKGGQNLLYFSAGYYAQAWGLTALGSFADTNYVYGDPAKNDFRLIALGDVTLSGYRLMPQKWGLDLRLGLDLNLPTGHPSFTNAEMQTLFLDGVTRDLVMMPAFGKGFNIAPNLVVSETFANGSVAGAGLRYEFSGQYDPTRDIAGDGYDPGDVLMLMGSVQHKLTEKDAVLFDLAITLSSRDKQGGAEVFKQGDSYDLTLRYIRATPVMRVTYGVNYGFQENNQSVGTGGITTENRNSNNNKLDLFINTGYLLAANTMLNGIFGHKIIYKNGYASGDALYDAGYRKIYFGGGFSYVVSEKLFFTVDARGYQITNEADTLEVSTASYRGVNIDLGLVYTFNY